MAPSDDDLRRAGRDEEDMPGRDDDDVGLVLRTASVIPFLLSGALGVIALVTWLVVLVFGVGLARGSAWSWAAGRPLGEVVPQVSLLLLLGLVCVAIILASVWATSIGFRTWQPPWFWRVAQGIFIAAGLALGFGRTLFPETMDEIGLAGRDWWFFFGVAVFSVLVTGARRRRQRLDA